MSVAVEETEESSDLTLEFSLHCWPSCQPPLLRTSSQTSLVSVGGHSSPPAHHQGHLTLCCTAFLGPGWSHTPHCSPRPANEEQFLGPRWSQPGHLAPLRSGARADTVTTTPPRPTASFQDTGRLSHCLPLPPSTCLPLLGPLQSTSPRLPGCKAKISSTGRLCVFL